MQVATSFLFGGGGGVSAPTTASLFGGLCFSSTTSKSSDLLAKMNQDLRDSQKQQNQVRKCSCGNALSKPDDLLCSTCSLFKPKNRCSAIGCLNDIDVTSASFNVAKRTEKCKQMCDKCAFRRKCSEWGCMKKCESAERDVCVQCLAKKEVK